MFKSRILHYGTCNLLYQSVSFSRFSDLAMGRTTEESWFDSRQRKEKCLFSQSIYTCSGTHPASNSVRTRIKVATQFRLVLKSSMCVELYLHPPIRLHSVNRYSFTFFTLLLVPNILFSVSFFTVLHNSHRPLSVWCSDSARNKLRLLAERCGSVGVLLSNLLTESSVMYTSN